ncbi:MAG: LysR family transcriptional regulator [Hyphomicrobiaceae bacterium]|nr:MAG: LysR family transcriptional regulator [Hyphomicrobiaceae bacterium]
MEIHQLKTFVTVAREGSITRASELLYLSQPAVSAHIKAIEDTLGLALFERTPRGMSLTADGTRLLAKAEETLLAHRGLIEEATRIKGRLTGRIRLGTVSNPNGEMLGRLLAALSERCPEVEVALKHRSSVDVLAGIRNGSLDAGFYNEAGTPPAELTTINVARFAIYLAAPPGMVAAGEPPDWKALAELPWICPTSGTCCGRVAEVFFETHNIRPKRIVSVDQESVTRTLIAGGVGVGLLHADSARDAQQAGEAELICEARETVSVLFAHLAGRSRDPVLSAVSSILRVLVPPAQRPG